jgi:hypothetical protein
VHKVEIARKPIPGAAVTGPQHSPPAEKVPAGLPRVVPPDKVH